MAFQSRIISHELTNKSQKASSETVNKYLSNEKDKMLVCRKHTEHLICKEKKTPYKNGLKTYSHIKKEDTC